MTDQYLTSVGLSEAECGPVLSPVAGGWTLTVKTRPIAFISAQTVRELRTREGVAELLPGKEGG